MKIINRYQEQYFIEVCPRINSEIVKGIARQKVTNSTTEFQTTSTVRNNVLTVELLDFEPKPNTTYEIYLLSENDETVWFGQATLLQ